jgi:methyltransferase family protein
MRRKVLRTIDALIAPAVYLAAWLLRAVRRAGVKQMPCSRAVLRRVGVFPILRHYYEPLFHPDDLMRPPVEDRRLPGLDLNTEEQLRLLGQLCWESEIRELERTARERSGEGFSFDNPVFGPGDAEFFYQLIRQLRPSILVEVGAGHSTILARTALTRNSSEDPSYRCRHICVEPYENPWLEGAGAEIVRVPLERVDKELFSGLGTQDILFIDSSHVIRPQGDVLTECLEILPILKPGVWVHFHDIFTPRDYPADWITEEVRFWNEQYLVEAFLALNREFELLAALNYLAHHHTERLASVCPVFGLNPARYEPGSFWIRRRRV